MAAAITEHRTLFIGGHWTEPSGDGVIEVVSPHDGQVVGRVPAATAKDVDAAVAAAARRSTTVPGRGRPSPSASRSSGGSPS